MIFELYHNNFNDIDSICIDRKKVTCTDTYSIQFFKSRRVTASRYVWMCKARYTDVILTEFVRSFLYLKITRILPLVSE